MMQARNGHGELTRYLVLFADDATDEGTRTLNNVAGLRTTNASDFDIRADFSIAGKADGVFWKDLGFAVVTAAADQIEALSGFILAQGPITMVERERKVYAIGSALADASGDATDAGSYTWGLEAINAPASEATGAGVRVAVLDTGMDLDHPDFADRTIVGNSFVDGEDVRDGHGHGTHVIGTACGPRSPASGPGYGVAYEADIYAGKVLNNEGAGTDGDILAGIAWAVQNGCSLISMSLGAPAVPGEPHSATFERAARRAMQRGTVIIAAAGNESRRSDGVIAPVGHPANCPSVMAVGAIDSDRGIADFSSGTVDPTGAVDVVAPGVDVHSSWPMPERHNSISGTSMATPHVSGVAALIAQAHGGRSWELWARLDQSAIRLPLPSTDVGAGLVQAPMK